MRTGNHPKRKAKEERNAIEIELREFPVPTHAESLFFICLQVNIPKLLNGCKIIKKTIQKCAQSIRYGLKDLPLASIWHRTTAHSAWVCVFDRRDMEMRGLKGQVEEGDGETGVSWIEGGGATLVSRAGATYCQGQGR